MDTQLKHNPTPKIDGNTKKEVSPKYQYGDNPDNATLEEAFCEMMEARRKYLIVKEKVYNMEIAPHIDSSAIANAREERVTSFQNFANHFANFQISFDLELKK